MANVRCPMCGKDNSPDAGQCSNCGARLKPLRPNDPPAVSQSSAGAAGNAPDDEPEWLRALRKDQPQEPVGDQSPDADAGGEAMPDWLSRIRSRAQEETDAAPAAENAQEELPDWLKSLGDAPAEESPRGAAPAAGRDDDWLAQLSEWDPASGPAESAPSPAAGEGLDWLREETTDVPGGEAPAETPAAREESYGVTGFLSAMEQDGEPEKEAGGSAAGGLFVSGDLSGWQNTPDAPTGTAGGAQETPGSEDLPDWLRSMDEETSPPPAETARSAGAAVFGDEDDLPDWLGDLSQPESGETEAPAAQQAVVDDLPEWLGGEAPAARTPAAGLPAAGMPAAEGDLPDWLAGRNGEESPPAEMSAPAQEPERSFSHEMEQPPADEAAESAPAGEEADVPEWLRDFGQPATSLAAGALFAEEEPAEPAAAPLATPAGASGEDVPDWLRAFDQQPPASDAVPPLIETEPLLASEPVFEGDQPFAMADLPDWLSDDSAQQAAEGEQTSELGGLPGNETLAQADLPEWVKEMRPIESIIPGEAQMAEAERRTENSGPLAGVSGVLPAEELATRYSKPPVYSVKLHMSEKQRVQASQLETILAQETQPLLIRPRRKSVQGLLLRVLVALVLLVGLTLPPLMGMQPLAQPQLFPVETQRMYEQIESGEAGPVLLAVDFEPAFYGEMRLAAQPVLEHLVSKNSRLVIVSTRPNGPALAQSLIASASERYPDYDPAGMTDNLGFLPGDTISLLEFAMQPALAAPANLGGELVWGRESLAGINSIRDFSSVIVLTDTAETGRAWVEQVRPQMGEAPLMMVTSAQAGPMMAPFVQSEQVRGMVSGQFGGVLYARWAKQESPAGSSLASFQIGMLIALGLAMLGALISGLLALLNRGQKEEE